MPQTEVFFYRDEDGRYEQAPEEFRATITIPEDPQDV